MPEAGHEEPPQADDLPEGWAQLTWRERRDIRFERWLEAAGVEFRSREVRDAYRERVQLIIDTVELRAPARVPLCPMLGLCVPRYGGLTVREAMYESDKLAPVWRSFHEDFLPDFASEPVLPGRPYDLLGSRDQLWPGHGVGDDESFQYVEGEYMEATEYDEFLADPSGFYMRRYLPRVAEAFEPLAALGSFAEIAQGLPFSLLPLTDPAVQEALQRLVAAGQAMDEGFGASLEMGGMLASELGLPALWGGGGAAPYDVLADFMRGTKGIVMDRYRRPEKILAVVERLVPVQIDAGLQTPLGGSPLVCFPLHKGADGFMSDEDYRTFYWPGLKAVVQVLIAEGLVPVLFAEGGYNSRLSVIADDELPVGSCVWWFDQTDMSAAKQALGGYACIAGNVPSDLLAVGTATQVEEYVTELLDACAPGGGFWLASGAVIDHATPEALGAMLETGRRWCY